MGNPPWELLQIAEKEFFATRSAEIANAKNKAVRTRLINQLERTNPELLQDFEDAKHFSDAQNKFIRESNRFSLTAVGKINTYAVFAETTRNLISPQGRVGVIVPTGIATDDTCKQFFGDLTQKQALASLYDFENREAIFTAVHRSYKFSLLGMSNTAIPSANFSFFLTKPKQTEDEARVFQLSGKDITLMNPNTLTCPVFRTKADADLTKKIYQQVPVLENEKTETLEKAITRPYPTVEELRQCLTEAMTQRRERITCDEEERLKYGYNITTHFRYAEERKESATVVAADGTKLLKLTYGETADIWRINRGLRRSKTQERGFKLDTDTGFWGDQKTEITSPEALHTEVNLMVSDTCNILMIEPVDLPEENQEEYLVTLQYVLERSIQAYYKLEGDELASERLGQGRHLLFWEAAEGGAGVLSQILENPQSFQYLAAEALDICHFKHPKESCTQACYEYLLSYRNQFDHPLINRHRIKPQLDKFKTSQIQRHCEASSREEQYQKLLQQTDPNSAFEREVLKEIYQQGLKLPDTTQELITEANCKPDFLYKSAKIAIFCDGSAHDHPQQQKQDQIQRDNLAYKSGYRVVSLHHRDNWKPQLEHLKSYF